VKIATTWTDDCQGKKDFDGDILRISTRYWPLGGGMYIYIPDDPRGLHRSDDPSIRPSAHSTIILSYEDDAGKQVDLDLIDQAFEGSSFDDVRGQVETWASAQLVRIASVLQKEFQS
jgi:hypothetical protein